jgi:linoleoyl-CoA desaturase
MLVLPLLVFAWWQVLIGFLIAMLTTGLILGLFFQLAHINSDAAFPEPVGNPPHIDNEWAVHQVETTVDFAPRNRLLSWYVGGLNYQIEHHLLPHICHLNYPRLAPIVRATCAEFGIRYNCYATWGQALASHWRELRLIGQSAEAEHGVNARG